MTTEAAILFDLRYSSLEAATSTPWLELRLGKTQQWTRMLRGQGQELHKTPGCFGWATCETQNSLGLETSSPVPETAWTLSQWSFDKFASHPEEQTGEEYYYALGNLKGLAYDTASEAELPEFRGKPVSQLAAEQFLKLDFLQALVSFLTALCAQYAQSGYQQPSIIWDALLYQKCQTNLGDKQGADKHYHQFLLLPPDLSHFVAQRNPELARLQQLVPYQIPKLDCTNSQRWAYALAALMFTQLCGEPPFQLVQPESKQLANSEERWHDAVMAIRNSHYIRAQLFRPELTDSWDQLLHDILCAPQLADNPQAKAKRLDHKIGNHPYPNENPAALASLEQWQQAQNLAQGQPNDSLWRNCSDEQIQQAKDRLELERRRREQSWDRSRFWRKKRSVVAICTALAIVAITIIYTPVKRALSPPPHSNHSAYDTAMLYYQAIDQLDPQLHSQLSYRGNQTIKGDGNILTMLFVNTQTRRGYEGRDVILKVKDWLQSKGLSADLGDPIPTVSLDFVPYGISQISISKNFASPKAEKLALEPPLTLEIPDGKQISLEAQYDIWFPGTFAPDPDEQTVPQQDSQAVATAPNSLEQLPEAIQPLHQRNRDLVTLIYRARKKAWYVHNIERSSQIIQHPLP